MSTKLFLRATQANSIGATYFDMLTAAGASATTAVVATTNGGTEIQWTQTSGGAELLFVSGRVPAGGFTLTTTDISIWASESGTGIDAAGAYRIFKRDSLGVETELGGGLYSDGVEFTKTTATEMSWTGNPTDTAFAENDRILLKIKAVEAAAGAMSVGTCTLTYDAADAATGDSFFNIAETVAFKAEETSVALTGQQATGTSGSLAASASTALTGQSSTVSIGTLVPSAAYSAALTGQAATGAAGSLAASASIALTGQAATAAAGTLTPAAPVSVPLTGLAATGSAGTLTISVSIQLSGVEATVAAGSPGFSVSLTGVQSTVGIGTLTASTVSAEVVEIVGGGNWRKLPKKQKRIRYSDYANREEYAAALAQALADSSIKIHADSEDDEEELDDDAIIQALTLVMTDERRTH